ncbi:hypothetical protein [Metabacillus fastidiosus]
MREFSLISKKEKIVLAGSFCRGIPGINEFIRILNKIHRII